MAFFEIPMLNTRLGTYRAYHLAFICFISSFLAGYDAGVAGGVLTFTPFEDDFRYKTAAEAKVDSLTVGLGNLGSFISCFIVYPLTTKFGRKYCIAGSAAVFVLGAVLQVINSHTLGCWYAGRIVAGLGLGGLSIVVPAYSAEMTPKEIRGRCGSFYQWLYTWGVFTAYWLDYGVELHFTDSAEWQIPVGLQIISSGLLAIGALTLPESVRWLLSQDRTDEAWKALTWMRADEGEKTIAEFNEIQLGLTAERRETSNFSIREIWQKENRLRFFVGPMLFIFQNTTGSSALAVFAPEFFKLLVGSKGNDDLLLTGLFGAVKVIACSFFIWVLSERLGRRVLLTWGAAAMAVCMLVTGLISTLIPDPTTGDVTAAGKATVAMIYLDIMVYNCSWGPVPWAYVPEIFPTRIRALGLGFSMLAHWASSFCFTFASPYMIDNISGNTFFIFMGFDVLATIFCFFFIRETRGQQLENSAGIDWQVAEKAHDSVSDSERGDQTTVANGSAILHPNGKGNGFVDEMTGKEIDVVSAQDNFNSKGLHHRHGGN